MQINQASAKINVRERPSFSSAAEYTYVLTYRTEYSKAADLFYVLGQWRFYLSLEGRKRPHDAADKT